MAKDNELINVDDGFMKFNRLLYYFSPFPSTFLTTFLIFLENLQ